MVSDFVHARRGIDPYILGKRAGPLRPNAMLANEVMIARNNMPGQVGGLTEPRHQSPDVSVGHGLAVKNVTGDQDIANVRRSRRPRNPIDDRGSRQLKCAPDRRIERVKRSPDVPVCRM